MFHLKSYIIFCIIIFFVFTGCTSRSEMPVTPNNHYLLAKGSKHIKNQKQHQFTAQQKRKKMPFEEERKKALEIFELKTILQKPIILHGSRQRKKIALTFDDGPESKYTPQILNILKQEGVPATFFVLGTLAKSHPTIIQRIVREGHVLANHSWQHQYLPHLSKSVLQNNLKKTNQVINKLTGKNMLLLRPPYGAAEGITDDMQALNYTVVNWDVDTLDWKPERTALEVYSSVMNHAKNGSIVLLHNGGGDRSATVLSLPRIIRELRNQGYTFVTVDQLLQIPAYSSH